MQWPSSSTIDDPVERDALQDAVARIANTIAEHEPVVMLADRTERRGNAGKLAAAVEIWDIPADDLWCRDSGPTFVMNGTGDLAVAHLHFNGWGGKQAHAHDGRIAALVAERLGVPLLETGLIGEQGGIEHDGAGLLLAHASSWAGAGRNALSLRDIGARLRHALGVDRVVWAPGLAGEDITDFHIDGLARFTAPGTVLIQIDAVPRRDDPWANAADETLRILDETRDGSDRPLRITKLPGPAHVRSNDPDFVASYVNYYVCNGAVIAPEFGDAAADAHARAVLSAAYPDRIVRMLNVDALAAAGGGIHCATQQQPARDD